MGADALSAADRLLTRNPDFYRRYLAQGAGFIDVTAADFKQDKIDYRVRNRDGGGPRPGSPKRRNRKSIPEAAPFGSSSYSLGSRGSQAYLELRAAVIHVVQY